MRPIPIFVALLAAGCVVTACGSSKDDAAPPDNVNGSLYVPEDDGYGGGVPADSEIPDSEYPDLEAEDVPEPEKVTFRILGNASRATQISYSVGGGIEQRIGRKLPWKKTLTVDEPSFTGFVINAQADADGSKIVCVIEQDGVELDRKTSRGPYAFVQCQAEDPNA